MMLVQIQMISVFNDFSFHFIARSDNKILNIGNLPCRISEDFTRVVFYETHFFNGRTTRVFDQFIIFVRNFIDV